MFDDGPLLASLFFASLDCCLVLSVLSYADNEFEILLRWSWFLPSLV